MKARLTKSLKFIAILSLFAGFHHHQLFASQPYKPKVHNPIMDTWRWQPVKELQGQSFVTMTSNEAGIIAVATSNKITIFDGYDWSAFSIYDHGFKGSAQSLVFDKNETLYAGTGGGLFKLKDKKWEKIYPLGDIADKNVSIRKLIVDDQNTLWASTSHGLIQYSDNNKKCVVYSTPMLVDSLSQQNTLSQYITMPILGDAMAGVGVTGFATYNNNGCVLSYNGVIYINNSGTQALLDEDTWVEHTPPMQCETNNISIDVFGNKIFGYNNTFVCQMVVYDLVSEKWTTYDLGQYGGNNLNLMLTETNDGKVWIGCLSTLIEYDNGELILYENPDIPTPFMRLLPHYSKSGVFYLAVNSGDLIQIEYSNAKYSVIDGLNYQAHTPDGRDWFTSYDKKVVTRKNDIWTAYSVEDGIMDHPFKMHLAKDGTLWVTGSHKGVSAVAWMENDQWNMYIAETLSWGFDFRSLQEDDEGNIFFGGCVDVLGERGQMGGILVYDHEVGLTNKTAAFRDIRPEGRNGTAATGMAYHNGQILSSNFGDLMLSDKYSMTPVQKPEVMRWAQFDYLFDDGENLYYGTRGNGLFIANKDSVYIHHGLHNGLSSNFITAIWAEDTTSIWVSTNNCISYYNGITWTNDVLPSKFTIPREGGEFKLGHDGTFYINKATHAWYRTSHRNRAPTKSAMSEFYTVVYNKDTLAPITQVTFYEKEIHQPGNAFVRWSAIDPWGRTATDKIQFSYKLDDGEWSPFTYEKSHMFPDLSNGNHTIYIRAMDDEFNIDSTPEKIEFRVIPPVYARAWFIIMVVVVFLVIIYLVVNSMKKAKVLEASNAEIIKAQKVLEDQTEEIKKRNEAEKVNSWMSNGLTDFNNLINKNKEDVHALSNVILSKLVKFLNANQASITLLNDDNPEDKYLEILGHYAYEEAKLRNARIELDEGLIGTCFKDGEPMIIDQLPPGYAKIKSGMGEAQPSHLILVPIRHDELVLGVTEILSFHPFEKHEVEFVERLGANMASTLYTMRMNKRAMALLEQSKLQEEELRAQEEEMRQNMEELQATQEDFLRKEKELMKQIEELKGK